MRKAILFFFKFLLVFFLFHPDLFAQQNNFTCNPTSPVKLILPTYTLSQASSSTGASAWDGTGVYFLGTNTTDKVVDANTTNFATAHILVTGSCTLRVGDGTNTYSAGDFAGFAVSNGALGLNVGGGIVVTTLLNGVLADQSSSTSLLAIKSSANGTYELGLITTKPFNQIEITFSALIGVQDYNVYYPIAKKYCAGPALVCNTPVVTSYPTYPVAINGNRTGVAGVNVGAVNTPENAVDNDDATAAELVNVAGTGSTFLSIRDAITTYAGGTYAGFDIKTTSLAGVNLNATLSISIYRNDTLKQTKTVSSGLISAPVLSAAGRQSLGFVADSSFNEVVITSSYTGANVGTTYVYGMRLEKFCAEPALACSTPTIKSVFTYPVVVDNANTGIVGTACVGCYISNPDSIIDNSSNTAATVVLTAGLNSSAQVAVKDVLYVDTANTFVGFDIQNSGLLGVSALGAVTITTYLKGAQQETQTGSGALVSINTSLLASSGRQIVGLVTSMPFDEVKMTINNLSAVNLSTTKIYSVIYEKMCAGMLSCNNTYLLRSPYFPVTIDATKTGITSGVACAACVVQNTFNVINSDTSDFATIQLTANVAASAQLAVKDAYTTYPVGTFAGFALRDVNGLVQATLLGSVSVSTYKNGVLQETQSNNNLLNLNVLIPIFGSTTTNKYTLGFVTTKSFDEIVLTVVPLVGAGVLNQQIQVYGAFVDTRTASGGALRCLVLNPDFNVTLKNVVATGNVQTNDVIPANMSYSTPVASPSNPSGANVTLTLNPSGTYSFVSDKTGVYNYTVPVCPTGQTTGCSSTALTITVIDPVAIASPPVANPDIAIVNGAPVTPLPTTINVRSNDGTGNAGGTLQTPSVTVQPGHGTATVDGNGNVVYTPTAGYYGVDILTYSVCETPSTLCATANVTITVIPPLIPNSTMAADDYISTYSAVAIAGNVSTNDIDPEGNPQTVSFATTTVAGKGTITYTANTGAYTFTPVYGFVGEVDFPYTATDNDATASATLHIVVRPFTLNPDFNATLVNVPVAGNVSTNDTKPAGTLYGTPVAVAGNPNSSVPVLATDGSYTFVTNTAGTYKYIVPACLPGTVINCPFDTLKIAVRDPNATTNPPTANPDFVTMIGSATTPPTAVVNVRVNDGVGNTGGTLGTPTIAAQPANGTATVDGNGNIAYTPAAGFYGKDVVNYTVCESPGTLCATSSVTFTVKAPDAPNSTIAVDDYMTVKNNTAATGNVKTNDSDPEGNTQTVATQNLTVTGKGTFVLDAAGNYTFTPVSTFFGPIDLVYSTCDDGSPSVCASATLHVVVLPLNTLMIQVKALLQGPLNGTVMTTILNQKGLIPLLHPYAASPFNYAGTESVSSIPAHVTDWVLVELRNALTPGTVIAAKACFIDSAGTIRDTTGSSTLYFKGLDNGSYHIAVRHRNHLGIRTATAQVLSNNVILPYDFTTALSQVNGTNAALQVGSVTVMWLGNTDYTLDANGKQSVIYSANASDVDIVKSAVISAPGNITRSSSYIGTEVTDVYSISDQNLDGLVRFSASPSDVDMIITNVNTFPTNNTRTSSFIGLVEQIQ